MAVEGIGSLVQSLREQLFEQANQTHAGAAPGAVTAANTFATSDTFTPSLPGNFGQAAAQDAAIFQASEGAISAVAASSLFAQGNANAVAGGGAAAGSPATTGAGNAQQAAATRSKIPAPGQLFAPAPAAQAATANQAATSKEQQQIQALNAALPAFGLSKEEIQEIDRLATQIQNFNPAAYTDLVNQFEAQARQLPQQNPPNAIPAAAKARGGGTQV